MDDSGRRHPGGRTAAFQRDATLDRGNYAENIDIDIARADLDGAELFDLIAALAWLREQPYHASRADRIFGLISSAIFVRQS